MMTIQITYPFRINVILTDKTANYMT